MKLLTMVTALGLWLMASGCSSNPDQLTAEQISKAKTSLTPIQSTSTQTSADPENGWNPQEACNFLFGLGGFQTRGYKNKYEDSYSCSSPYLEFPDGSPLPDNVAYYVNGNAQIANELKIVLNVNSSQPAKHAHEMFLIASEELTKKALDTPQTKEINKAVQFSKTGKWTIGKADVELKRENNPSGKGYELQYIIRKKA